MRILIALALFGACQVDDRPRHRVIPGGPVPPVGGATADGAVDDAGIRSDGGMLQGRVCLVTDLRDVSTCASTGAGGLTVALGTKSATTLADGSFSIEAPVGSDLVWQVSGASIQTSIAPFSAMSSIPVITTLDFLQLESDHSVLEVVGQGSVLAHVVFADSPKVPVVMAKATASPLGAYLPLYDGSVAGLWTQNFTGAFGAVWVPGLLAGTVALTIAAPGGATKTINGLPVVDRAITFATVAIGM